MASRVGPGGSQGTRHSATQVSGPSLPYPSGAWCSSRIAGHQSDYAIEIVGIDSVFEFGGLLQGFDMVLEFRPARKSVGAGDLEQGFGNRFRRASLEQIFGLILEMADIGTLRERLGMGRHSDLLS